MLDYKGTPTPLFSKNSSSAIDNPYLVTEKINCELAASRIDGPFDFPPFEDFKISPLALRAKKDSGKFRLLHNLSYPYNEESINYNINDADSKVTYESLSTAIDIIQNLPSVWLAKADIADAFRLIPLHSSQFNLTGFSFNDNFYYDKCLPQGCSSSCKIFERFSSALKWILKTYFSIVNVVKVLDDFLFIADSYDTCNLYLKTFQKLCEYLNVPLAHRKTEGPTQVLTFLGIELDVSCMLARLPLDKLNTYMSDVDNLISKNKCTLRQMRSIIGKLQFSTSVITVGKPFLRRLYDSIIGVKKPHHYVRITKSMKYDLEIWKQFLCHFNGKTILGKKSLVTSDMFNFFSDSSKIGYGAVFGKNFIYGSFPEDWRKLDIQFLELYPIFLAVETFKFELINKFVIFHSDNSSVVHAINKQSSRNKLVMLLIRPLVLTFLQYNITFKARHIPGKHNILCDRLSRLQVLPQMLEEYGINPTPTPIAAHLRPHNFRVTY